MGMRAGTILGIMEGLLRGFEERGPGAVKKRTATTPTETELAERKRKADQVRSLYQDAVKELDVQAVFAGGQKETTRAEVVPAGQGVEEKAETQLARKGEDVLAKWEGRAVVPRWEENMEALEMKDEGSKGQNQSQSQSQSQNQTVEQS
jgi:glucan-binding YG repeat protein